LAAALAGVRPLVAMSWGFDLLEDAQRGVGRWAARRALRGADILLCDCDAVRREAVSLGMDAERIVVFPWGVDLRRFRPGGSRAVRRALGWEDEFILLATRSWERRYGIEVLLEAFAAVLPYAPAAHLLLAGASAAHYDVKADIARRGLDARVTLTGYLDTDEALTAAIAASDVALNLRWPTAREVSGPWLRSLAAGKPTVIIDLAHLADVPSVDPRTWRPNMSGHEPVTVAVDIMDEDHSLRLAMRRLATDAALRGSLGRAGREYWRREHSPAMMLEDYRRVIGRAASLPAPAVTLPPHLRNRGDGTLRAILDEMGCSSACEL